MEITEAGIASMVEKLAVFVRTLSIAERVALARVIVRVAQAVQAEAEAQGFLTLIEAPELLESALVRLALQTTLSQCAECA